MTVTHIYAVDDLVDLTPHLHPSFGPRHPDHADFSPSPAMLKVASVGNICNNAFRNETGINVGQATEVALLNVLPVLGREDERKVASSTTLLGQADSIDSRSSGRTRYHSAPTPRL